MPIHLYPGRIFQDGGIEACARKPQWNTVGLLAFHQFSVKFLSRALDISEHQLLLDSCSILTSMPCTTSVWSSVLIGLHAWQVDERLAG